VTREDPIKLCTRHYTSAVEGPILNKIFHWVNHQTKRRARRSCEGITAAMEARSSDHRAGRPVYFPVRYADDFIFLISGAAEDAAAEREALATLLQQRMGLTLLPGKTRITPLTDGFEFL
jgi:RNA-directed DNA polymerase